jgi:hypothetical protein
LGQTAGGGRQSPEQRADQDNPLAIAAVGEAAEQKPEQHEEYHEGRTCEQANLRVAEMKVTLDRRKEEGENLPLDVGNHVDQRERCHGEPSVAGRRECLGRIPSLDG